MKTLDSIFGFLNILRRMYAMLKILESVWEKFSVSVLVSMRLSHKGLIQAIFRLWLLIV